MQRSGGESKISPDNRNRAYTSCVQGALDVKEQDDAGPCFTVPWMEQESCFNADICLGVAWAKNLFFVALRICDRKL